VIDLTTFGPDPARTRVPVPPAFETHDRMALMRSLTTGPTVRRVLHLWWPMMLAIASLGAWQIIGRAAPDLGEHPLYSLAGFLLFLVTLVLVVQSVGHFIGLRCDWRCPMDYPADLGLELQVHDRALHTAHQRFHPAEMVGLPVLFAIGLVTPPLVAAVLWIWLVSWIGYQARVLTTHRRLRPWC